MQKHYYYGIVTNRADPLFLGRVKVRIFEIHSPDILDQPDSDLSWCIVRLPVTNSATSGNGFSPIGIVEGTFVQLICLDGEDMQQWMVVGTVGGFQSKPLPNGSSDYFTNVNPPSADNSTIPNADGSTSPTTSTIQSTTGWKLGQTSEKYESGGRGPGTISADQSADAGGKSYGSFQYATYSPTVRPDGRSRKGYNGSPLQSYLKTSKWGFRFNGLTPVSSEFDAMWKKIAAEDPQGFGNEQHDYIKANYYDVMVNRLKRTGLDLTKYGPAVQDLIWSTAVQFGPGKTSIFTSTIQGKSNLTDTTIVNLVTDYKISIFPQTATRYRAERNDLLKLCTDTVSPMTQDQAETAINPVPYDASNPTNNTTMLDSRTGFSDPNNVYPKQEYNTLPDTNKLAYGSEKGTQSADKTNNRGNGYNLPNGETFQQPRNPYNAQYPFNKVFQSESGSIVEFDDTPGSERINVYHKSGTFIEIDSVGNMVRRTVGADYQITDSNSYVAIDGRWNISIGGNAAIMIGGSADIEVSGDTTLNCGNNIVASAGGRMSLSAVEAIDLKSDKIFIDAETAIHMKTKDIFVESDTTINLKSTDIFVESSSNVNMKSGADIKLDSGATMNILSGSDTVVTGANIQLNGPAAASADSATTASLSQGVMADGRTDYDEKIISESYPTKADSAVIALETSEDAGAVSAYHKQLIDLGIATQSQLASTPAEQTKDDSSVTNTKMPSNVTCAYINTLGNIPTTFRLSQNFTLAQLSSNAAVSRYPVVAQSGLSVSQIVCNLYQVANNVLEPIKQKYPNAFVTSGFRTIASSIATSQHVKGMAVDIQFKGVKASDYYAIAVEIRKLLGGNFCQLLLEYSNYANNPWIHVSYDPNGNKGQVMTFWNNRKHSDGLAKLM